MKLNSDIPSFKGFIRKSYLTKNDNDKNIFINVYCFGIQSVSGAILTFHVMTDDGMLRSRVPISELKMKAKAVEKQQILSAFDSGEACWYDDFSEYYTSTYGQ